MKVIGNFTRSILGVASVLVFAAACGKSETPAGDTTPPESAAATTAQTGAATPAAQAGGATVTGTIVYEGAAPTMKEIKMAADPTCAMKHSGPVRAEDLVLGDGQTMGNVFVQVKSGLPNKTYPVPTEPVVLDQQGCIYHPHVFGIQAGQTLKILNSDGTLHNVHAMPKVNRNFNLAMPKTKTEATAVFDKPEGMFPIKCDVHPWMGAYATVLSHPFFDTTETDGKFTISGLEPGTYEIEAWHERLGTKTATVTVAADATETVNFSFAVPTR